MAAAAVETQHMYESAERRLEQARTARDSEGWPFRFDVIPIKQMEVDAYQRPLTTFVDKIEREFDPALLGTVVLSQRSKTKYALVDGQTRAEGAKRRGVAALPAIVYEGLTVQQEAELFAKFQTERRRMHTCDLFNAQVHAGLEPQVTIARITESMGYRIDQNPGTDRKGISAPGALTFVYNGCTSGKQRKHESPELLEQVLEVISESWPNAPMEARSAQLIKGLGYFLKHHDDLDLGRLIDRLGRIMPSELAKRASSLQEGHGANATSPRYMSEAIDSQYRRMAR